MALSRSFERACGNGRYRAPIADGDLLRQRLCARRRVDDDCTEARRANTPGRRQRLRFRHGAIGPSFARHVGATVGEKDEHRRVALSTRRVGQRERRFDARRQRSAAAAGQSCQATLGSHERARGRQDEFGAAAAEREQGDSIASHVALGEQQFDRALGLTESMQRSGTGGIDDENRRGPRMPAIALHPEILGAHFDAGRLRGTMASGRCTQASTHRLPRRRRPQRLDDVQPRAASRLTAYDTGRPAARPALLFLARASCTGAARLDRCRDLQLREQPRWNRRSSGREHDVFERAILRARLLLRAFDRRLRRRLGFGRLGRLRPVPAANVSPSVRAPAWQRRLRVLP